MSGGGEHGRAIGRSSFSADSNGSGGGADVARGPGPGRWWRGGSEAKARDRSRGSWRWIGRRCGAGCKSAAGNRGKAASGPARSILTSSSSSGAGRKWAGTGRAYIIGNWRRWDSAAAISKYRLLKPRRDRRRWQEAATVRLELSRANRRRSTTASPVSMGEHPETVHLFVFTLGYSRRLFTAGIATSGWPRCSTATSERFATLAA